MENKKGNGIFLGVVGVATLVVAIIGATFAFFSANASSDDNAIELDAYNFTGSLSVSQVYPTTGTSLIPLDPDEAVAGASAPNNTNLLYALNVATNRCLDDKGFIVCALYEVTFSNSGSQPLVMNGVIKTTANTAAGEGSNPFSNLTYQDVSGTLSSLTLVGSPVTLATEVGSSSPAIASVTVPAAVGETPGQITKYVLIYLNDNGDQSAEMGATFSGQLIYTSLSGDGSGLTGTFTVAG